MKQFILLFFSFLFLSTTTIAQDLTFTTNPVMVSGQYDLTDDFYIVKSHTVMTNATTETLQLRWTVSKINVPGMWYGQLCDNNGCYPWEVSTNVTDFTSDPTLDLAPGDTSLMDFGIRHRGEAGTGTYEIKVTTVQDTATVLGTITYEFTVESDGTSSINEFNKAAVKVFPNPTDSYFTLTENPYVKEVQIFNIVGKRMLFTPYQDGTAVNVSSFPNGLYLVRMLDRDGEVLKTTRLTKR